MFIEIGIVIFLSLGLILFESLVIITESASVILKAVYLTTFTFLIGKKEKSESHVIY